LKVAETPKRVAIIIKASIAEVAVFSHISKNIDPRQLIEKETIRVR